jgi:hypothetical protein
MALLLNWTHSSRLAAIKIGTPPMWFGSACWNLARFVCQLMDVQRSNEHSICGVLTGVRNMWPEAFLDTREQQVNYSCSTTQTDRRLRWLTINRVFTWAENPLWCFRSPEDGSSMLIRNAAIHLRGCKLSHCRTNLKSHIKNEDPVHVTKRCEWREAHIHSFVSSHKRSGWSDSQSGKRLKGTHCFTR